jgi:hypothetical protein
MLLAPRPLTIGPDAEWLADRSRLHTSGEIRADCMGTRHPDYGTLRNRLSTVGETVKVRALTAATASRQRN